MRGPDPSLLEELYIPALSEAVRYDRCCAYFSSTVLAAAARGFGRLIGRLERMGTKAPRPAVRLVVNEELSKQDVRAMTELGDLSRLEAHLQRRFKNPIEALEKERLAMLGWLVKHGLLAMRVGVMRRGEGIVHAKFGIATDEADDAVVFSGSGNESAQGLAGNYERLEVSTSWQDRERYQEYVDEFKALWNDTHPDVHTVTLPEALRLRLIKFAPKEAPLGEPSDALGRQRAAMIWRYIVDAPYLPNGETACDATAMVDLWPHQQRVVEETAAAWPAGRLLCDEVGMGKTIEAILVLRRLLAGRGVRRALLLLPAGLLKQWQAEMREKGGMVFPRLEGTNTLVWPDEREERVSSLAEALEQDILLMSRETARTETNAPLLLAAKPWDLVILDESHAARRRKQEEGEFNSGTLLLNLLRQLQLRGRTRGFLLLSATPMQTHPWEPWDLLSVLGEGGAWLADFAAVRAFYGAIAAVRGGRCGIETARKVARLMVADPDFPPPPGDEAQHTDAVAVANRLAFVPASRRSDTAEWMRRGSPLARRMHRNTRGTLRRYYEMGLLPYPPPRREVTDELFDFRDAAERRVYNSVSEYIERRYEELESEKPGKGFVMTVYRRRASSSPLALQRSLERRRDGLRRVVERRAFDPALPSGDVPEALDVSDLPEEESGGRVSAAFPENPEAARRELDEVERVLVNLADLRGTDTKRDVFFDALRRVTADGRPVLVFTEYTDTLEYLRDYLVTDYGSALGCYSGEGGQRWDGGSWRPVTKDVITKALRSGEVRALICTDAASEGLNLQAAGAVVNYDLPWNPSKVEQRIGRIDRIGQILPEVRVVNLFLKDSVDDRVYRALRERCGLFQHFVGSMQPVLARARRMLIGQAPVDAGALASAADEVRLDPVLEETYLENPAENTSSATPAVSRADLEAALVRLDVKPGRRARSAKSLGRPSISSDGVAKTAFSTSIGEFERDRTVVPLSPTEPRLRQIVEALARPGERLPLVLGAYEKGSFRRALAYWVGDRDTSPVESYGDLVARVDGWDGTYPDPDLWLRAETVARSEAEKQVAVMEARAAQIEHRAFQRQIDAARLRLQRELGRYLVCVAGGSASLNDAVHAQMSRDIATAGRLKRCLERLGGYPDWPTDMCDELQTFLDQLPENQRKARLLGREIEAALEDPRWGATG